MSTQLLTAARNSKHLPLIFKRYKLEGYEITSNMLFYKQRDNIEIWADIINAHTLHKNDAEMADICIYVV